MKRRICIAQISYFLENTQVHIERIKDIIYENRDSDLIVFPELVLHGHPSLEKPEGLLYRKLKLHYESISEDMYRFIKKTDARVILGEIKKKREKFFNVATYVDRDSTESYIKTHVHWTENFAPGNELKVFRTPLGNIGINICFDAAFPEVWRVLALKESDIIVNISAVPRTFPVKYMWRRMSGAAMNNQVFVIYANRAGDYFCGHSAVFDPRGDVLVNLDEREAIINTEIDLDEVSEWRDLEMIYPHRRPLLYRDIARKHVSATKEILLKEVAHG